ncbi:hypothetical protein [Geobacillus jurassicus]|uniref:Uncharacterized protein n=1 Tax=Geobacillus jurassicus TaxID=235932 RepID=A0ABV6GWM6_9BACL|nr:hypothetical protein [Geobacillus jurassicus]
MVKKATIPAAGYGTRSLPVAGEGCQGKLVAGTRVDIGTADGYMALLSAVWKGK